MRLWKQEDVMNSAISKASVLRDQHPILWVLAAFPATCFTGALCTDAAYMQTSNIMWADFSDWLLAVGMAGGVLAAIVGLIGWITGRQSGTRQSAWVIAVGGLLTLVIALFNNLVHSRDAWTSVMPMGIALSIVTVLVMLATGLFAAAATRRVIAVPYSGVR
jgi:uncharacterized membrane protein